MLSHLISEIWIIFQELLQKEEIILFLILVGFAGLFVAVPVLNTSAFIARMLEYFYATWWLWLFVVLLPLFEHLWIFWRQELYMRSREYILLELQMPREILKSAQAMEQVFLTLHTFGSAPGNFPEKYIEGVTTTWNALEIVSFGGEIHFYVRCQKSQRNIIEAAFFSYYKDVEIAEVKDYTEMFPHSVREMYEKEQDIWGAEMVLAREDAYPIKTYTSFESDVEEKNVDPLSVFLESFAKVRPGETVGIQFLIAPAAKDWFKVWAKFLAKLKEPETIDVGSGEEKRKVAVARSPGQSDVIEAIEKNLSKPAFRTIIRSIYLSPKTSFSKDMGKSVTTAFNQYTELSLNAFKSNSRAGTRADLWTWPHVMTSQRTEYRKQRLLWNYCMRETPPDSPIGRLLTSYLLNWNFASRDFTLNVEGLATLFHPPTAVVLTAPHIKRVESRKAGPPAGLAIFGEEGEIERFK